METGKKTAGNQLPEAEVFFSDVEFRKAVDVAVIRRAYEDANKKVSSQYESNNRLKRMSGTLLGWIVAALISLAGAIVALYPGGWSVALIMAVYAFADLFVPAGILVFRLHYGNIFHIPGHAPRYSLSRPMCDYMKKLRPEDQEKMFLVHMLQNRQMDIDANDAAHLRHVKAYRAAVISIFSIIIVGAVLFTCLVIAL